MPKVKVRRIKRGKYLPRTRELKLLQVELASLSVRLKNLVEKFQQGESVERRSLECVQSQQVIIRNLEQRLNSSATTADESPGSETGSGNRSQDKTQPCEDLFAAADSSKSIESNGSD